MTHEIFDQLIKPAMTVWDVGANHGNKTHMFLERGARVVAFEPQPQCVTALQDQFNNDPRVVVEPVALGIAPGHMTMRIGEADTLSTLSTEFIKATQALRFQGHRWVRNVLVPVETLDRMIEKHGLPDFCKIDVEGYEHAVLQGLSKPVPVISIEFTPELKEQTHRCIQHLLTLCEHYEFNYSEGESGRFTFPHFVGPYQMWSFLQANTDYSVSFGDMYAKC